MKHVSTTATNQLLNYTRRGALLLALGAAGPAAWGQSFTLDATYITGGNSEFSVALGDVNSDGRLDIVTANSASQRVSVLLNQASGGLAPALFYPTGTASNQPIGAALGDMNLDGRLDIVTANSTSGNVSVLLSQASGGFAPASLYSIGAGSQPFKVAVGDINGDGRPDIVTANNGNSTIGVLLGQTSGGFAPAITYPTGAGSQPMHVALGDVNNDGRPDIVVANATSGNVGVLLGQAGGFAPISLYATGPNDTPYSVALGDVNGDGRTDIVAANLGTSTAGVLLGQPNGFAAVSLYSFGASTQPYGIALSDTNGDGRLDIVASNSSTSAANVLLGQAGGFAPANTYFSTGRPPQSLAMGDIDGDRRPDIVLTHNGMVSVLLNTGTYTPLATTRPTDADIALYPNPAHTSFTVQLPAAFGPAQAELLNALGQVVRRPAAAGHRFSVDTDGLAPGIYTLRLVSAAGTVARRVVVE